MINIIKTAIITVSKSDHDYIKEWYDWHIKLGITDIFVADNNTENNKYDFSELEHLHIIPWHTQFDNGMPAVTQIEIMNTLLQDYIIGNYDYCISIDVDEFIDLHNNYINVNDLIQKELIEPNKQVLRIPWRYYKSEYIYEKDLPTNSVILNYPNPLGYDYDNRAGNYFNSSEYKSLFKVNPNSKYGNIRFVHEPVGDYGINIFVCKENIRNSKYHLRHYRTKCLETFIKNKLHNQRFASHAYAWQDKRFMISLYVFINGRIPDIKNKYNELCEKYSVTDYII